MPVSAQSAELIRGFYAAFPERLRHRRAGVLEPHHARFYTADHAMEMPDVLPGPATFVGLDGYRTPSSLSHERALEAARAHAA